jgi:hypothetical protein
MTNPVLETVGQLASALGGVAGIGALFTIGIRRRQERATASRTEADATTALTNTALGMLMPLKAQSAYLAGELEQSRTEAERLRDDVHRIADELHTSRDTVALLRDDVRKLHEYVGDLLKIISDANLSGMLAAPMQVPPAPVLKDNPAKYLAARRSPSRKATP